MPVFFDISSKDMMSARAKSAKISVHSHAIITLSPTFQGECDVALALRLRESDIRATIKA